ncbi:MAG: protein kinase [Paludibacteraceae bacterium]|nr:protein kinase [Paludibacteraceae bacterium]MBR6117028.1 protein kinase [Paludibacteraceae bacterium]
MLQPGTLFDNRYELIRLLGRGGFAEVWLVRDTLTNLEEALKIYAPGGGMDEGGLKIFAQELAVVHDLRHTNLLTPKTLGQYERQPYLLLPYCPNGSLVKKIGKCTEDEAWSILEQVAAGLAYLHEQGIVHQDIKPDNILIDKKGNCVITDFGISLKAQSTLRKSMMTQTFAGSLDYMAPERFSAEPDPTPASDMWSLGVTMFEIVEGKLPFVPQMGGLAQKKGADIPVMHADVSDKMKQTIYSLLSLDPRDRPTAEEVIELTKNKSVPRPKTEKIIIGETFSDSEPDDTECEIEPVDGGEAVDLSNPETDEFNTKPKSKRIYWIGIIVFLLLGIGAVLGRWVHKVNNVPVFKSDYQHSFIQNYNDTIGFDLNAQLREGMLPIEWIVDVEGVTVDPNGYLYIDSTYETESSTLIKVKAEYRGKEYEDSISVHLEYVKAEKPEVEAAKQDIDKPKKESTKEDKKEETNKSEEPKTEETAPQAPTLAPIPKGYVDLGLPSGTLWKTRNEDDAITFKQAQKKYGINLPTKAQWEELVKYCSWSLVDNGSWEQMSEDGSQWAHMGDEPYYVVKGKNSQYITLPFEGYVDEDGGLCVACGGIGGIGGYYYSSTSVGKNDFYYMGLDAKSKGCYKFGLTSVCYLSIRLVYNR